MKKLFLLFSISMLLVNCSTENIQPDINSPYDMVDIAGGTFTLDASITLSDYQISKYEITNQQYVDFLNEIGASSEGSLGAVLYRFMNWDVDIIYSSGNFSVQTGLENRPVRNVTWYGADAFARHYNDRLPTVAEWEFAKRGGNSSHNYVFSGSDNAVEVAWCYEGVVASAVAPKLLAVGSKLPNELGIYDMNGNVMEWTNDYYESGFVLSGVNPQGPNATLYKSSRGGGYMTPIDYLNRSVHDVLDEYAPDQGFRVAR